eukprot:CAMPEP_0197873278 /NCGR_PEP_ID=MMETSP1439-20131203/3111_1 /TAXON_ID=66791 /ORGANISM="Gonyaulax spinifera, Strain CCMP409" /LENGTH=423 /DNA_ID=CAMNT_0043492321 /DNA_START=39 /DNA_END=1307 /DNA_ORIENTATION=+
MALVSRDPYDLVVELGCEAVPLHHADCPRATSSRVWRSRALVMGVLCLGALGCLAGFKWRESHRSQRVSSDSMDVMEKYVTLGHESAFITWKKHPTKCWSMPDGEIKNARKLQIWDCPDAASQEAPERFIIPAGGVGQIRPARFPEFCLDAPAHSTTVQWWRCDDPAVPKDNLQWSVPMGREGFFRPTSWENRCIDIPNDNTTNGRKLQQWECLPGRPGNEAFVVHWPIDCRWEEWTEWTRCSQFCGGGIRKRWRREGQASVDGGQLCDGAEEQDERCNLKKCVGDVKKLPSDDLRDFKKSAMRNSAGSFHQGSLTVLITVCLLAVFDRAQAGGACSHSAFETLLEAKRGREDGEAAAQHRGFNSRSGRGWLENADAGRRGCPPFSGTTAQIGRGEAALSASGPGTTRRRAGPRTLAGDQKEG